MQSTSSDRLTICTAVHADVPLLCELLAILFSQEREFQPHYDHQRGALEALLANAQQATLWVARDGDQILGMLSLQYVISTALGGRVAWLEDVIVHPEARGRKIGERLLKHALKTAQTEGCLRVSLLSDADNVDAQRFYQRQGFVHSAMQPMRWLANPQTVLADGDTSRE